MADEQPVHLLTSPLVSWPGEIRLPHSDQFSGPMFRTWKDSVNRPLRSAYAIVHLYAYAGLELIAAHGEWGLDIPLGEVQAWETDVQAERTKLLAWLAREIRAYIDDVTDPKE